MTISERLFSIMKKKNISMPELSRLTSISRHTIFDWQKKNTNPGSYSGYSLLRKGSLPSGS